MLKSISENTHSICPTELLNIFKFYLLCLCFPPAVRKRPHTASVVVNVGSCATFDVEFGPAVTHRFQAHVRLSVIDNQYEDSIIQLVGEGYEDDITLDNVHGIVSHLDQQSEEGSMADDDVTGNCVMLD